MVHGVNRYEGKPIKFTVFDYYTIFIEDNGKNANDLMANRNCDELLLLLLLQVFGKRTAV